LLLKAEYLLQGKVEISGAKNTALPIIAAILLAPGKSIIRKVNAPRLLDLSAEDS
jgi:UDP-N-acetylglucosamine enolpyruvyl transferase